MLARVKACLACGTEETEDATLGICPLCSERKLPLTYFCSRACQRSVWKDHLKWHEEQQEEAAGMQGLSATADAYAARAACTGDRYDALLAEAAQQMAEAHFRHADKTIRKAIKLQPDRPVAYQQLARVRNALADSVGAAGMYLKAMERCQAGSRNWAVSAAGAFTELVQPENADTVKPEWWTDEGLKALSLRMVAAATEGYTAHVTRAFVLSGQRSSWLGGPRTAEELKEAVRCFQRAATLTPDRESKRWCIEMGVEINRKLANTHEPYTGDLLGRDLSGER